jgi:hypothetical protein
MKKAVFLKKMFIAAAVATAILLVLSFFTGCKLALDSNKIDSSGVSDESQEIKSDGQSSAVLHKDFPSEVPVYPGSELVESINNESASYMARFKADGNISEVSEWYKKKLEKDWSLGPVSEGDMGDWSEFFVEAQSKDCMLTVYLYQEEGSNSVSIDLTVSGIAGAEAVQDGDNNADLAEENISEESVEQIAEPEQSDAYSGELENAKIAFVCASVGSAWNIGQHFPQLNISVYDEYQFDKGYRIQEIIDSENPDIMIIKECAAYFPPDSQGSSMGGYQDLIRDWVNLCRGHGVICVLTTVVPIDPGNPSNSGRGQLDSIIGFNDWIRQYCLDENISVLDLEKAMRISDSDRALNPAYDSGDGLHLNEQAYSEKLDGLLIPALEKALETGK